jgi:hypothetical protein
MRHLDEAEVMNQVRYFEADPSERIISDNAVSTIASWWYSPASPALCIMATYPEMNDIRRAMLTDDSGDYDPYGWENLLAEFQTEHAMMIKSGQYSPELQAQYTRQFEAVYAWIAKQVERESETAGKQ